VTVYLPATRDQLRTWLDAGSAEPDDGIGYAVTPALVEAVGEADEEELTLTALGAAARASIALGRNRGEAGPLATVLVVDVEPAGPIAGGHPARVAQVAVPRDRFLAGYLGDRSLTDAIDPKGAQSPDDDSALGIRLAWYAVQELPDLFG
jgi:hypothetical protein